MKFFFSTWIEKPLLIFIYLLSVYTFSPPLVCLTLTYYSIMEPDYEPFSLKRNLFPRQPDLNTNSLICGHLNRLKFPPNIRGYLQWRREGVGIGKAMSKAHRCFCRREGLAKDPAKEQMLQIENDIKENRGLVEKLENLEIKAPRQAQKTTTKGVLL